MGILDGNPKNEPLHYGEITNLWSLSILGKGMISCLQAYHNHAGDEDLKQLLDDMIKQTKQEVEESDAVLKANGITRLLDCRRGRRWTWRIFRPAQDSPMRRLQRLYP